MPKDIADILVYFRPLFPHQETDWEEQIISFGYTTSPKEKETKIRGGFASKYEEPILNCRVSLAGNWKILTLAYLEDMKQGKDHSLEILEKHILQKRKNHFDYNKSLNWLFEHHRAQKLFTRCVNFDDGVKKLFKLATTDLIQDTAEGLIFRASTSEYFSQPILIKQTIVIYGKRLSTRES
jgi:hypothetical protein